MPTRLGCLSTFPQGSAMAVLAPLCGCLPSLSPLLLNDCGSSGCRAMSAEGPDEASDNEEALGEVVHS